jgi:hypothetical protein
MMQNYPSCGSHCRHATQQWQNFKQTDTGPLPYCHSPALELLLSRGTARPSVHSNLQCAWQGRPRSTLDHLMRHGTASLALVGHPAQDTTISGKCCRHVMLCNWQAIAAGSSLHLSSSATCSFLSDVSANLASISNQKRMHNTYLQKLRCFAKQLTSGSGCTCHTGLVISAIRHAQKHQGSRQ